MENTLHITNGDSAVAVMKKAGIQGSFLPWRDVLHVGPVPQGPDLYELSKIRAEYISSQGWGEPKAIMENFRERDLRLEKAFEYDKVLLWFEHDLYDQLQIAQLLSWFFEHPMPQTQLCMICTDQYLGCLQPEQILELHPFEQEISPEQLSLGEKIWSAFRAPTPKMLMTLLHENTSILPFMHAAIERLLAEYPDCSSGLSLTEKHILAIIAKGEKRPGRIFAAYQEQEEPRFMGDTIFWQILTHLLESSPPLLRLPQGKKLTLPSSPDQELSLTDAGRETLAGNRNRLISNTIDCWIGGVHLHPDNLWCRHGGVQGIHKISQP